ncbi:MAG: hypothetical protein Q9225_006353 [Loekoesia sp. 1 TL-2023]
MASPVLVESMAPGSARDRIPHAHMTGKESQVVTNTGAVVKHGNGFVWHKFKNLPSWEHAVYHQLIRRHLIDFEKTKDIEPVSGRGEDADVTSYHEDQKTWGPNRNDFPPILFTYVAPSEKQPRGPIQYMYFNRMIVLDKDHRPVRAFPELNSTFSSKVEGFRLEALFRLNPMIASRDILARMPTEVTVIRDGRQIIRPQCKSNALSMRRREFRGRNCMLSWTPREGSKEVKNYLDSLMGPHLVALNSTREMRPLTRGEIEHILFLGKGTHPERSRYKNSKSDTSTQRSTRKNATEESEKAGESESEIPTDLEDHFEPIYPDELEDEDEGPTSIEDHFEPLDPNDIKDETSSLPPHSPDLESDLNDSSDCRNHIPTNLDEMRAIAEAMETTIDHYKCLLDVNITFETSHFHRESYNTQWFAMQEALEKGWIRQGRALEDCPQLIRLARWEGDIWNWTDALVESGID